MEIKMEFLRIIIPIATGALIGYCTNYIAIKMLFHPSKEVYIGNFKLPFTPGVIPKNQPRIAQAVGNAVSTQLLTSDDILDTIKDSKVTGALTNGIEDFLFSESITIEELVNDEKGEATERISLAIANEITESAQKIDFKGIIADIASNALGDILNNPLVAMLLSESRLDSIYENISSSLKDYIKTYGKDAIVPVVKEKIDDIKSRPLNDCMGMLDVKRDTVREITSGIIERFIDNNGPGIVENINISEIVKNKIEEMDPGELEALTLSVMKNELQAVINLGAVIGAIIGIINIIF